jgi:hypothetical protein
MFLAACFRALWAMLCWAFLPLCVVSAWANSQEVTDKMQPNPTPTPLADPMHLVPAMDGAVATLMTYAQMVLTKVWPIILLFLAITFFNTIKKKLLH